MGGHRVATCVQQSTDYIIEHVAAVSRATFVMPAFNGTHCNGLWYVIGQQA